MRKWKIVFLLVSIILFTVSAYAESEYDTQSDIRVRPGMQVIKTGDTNILVPKGGKPYTEPGRIYMESSDEYSARKFQDTENSIKKIDRDIEDLKKDMEVIKTVVSKIAVQQQDQGKAQQAQTQTQAQAEVEENIE